MKNIINDKRIENILKSFKVNDSVDLSLNEKQTMLASVFDRAENKTVPTVNAVKSPFYNYFTQYLRYSIPVLLIAIIGTQAAGVFTDRSKVAISDINDVKSSLSDLKRDNAIKSNLSKNKQDIQEIKTLALLNQDGSQSFKKGILADQISTRSKEIRNQVAALVSENKISEAKNVALDLETALKADQLYKVATSVQSEVFSAIDLRVDVEKKEVNNISTTTEVDVTKKIQQAQKDILAFDVNASTTEMIDSAKKALETSDEYLKDKDFQNAIISLQLHDRIVAELKTILLP
jgi:hypothetical protein